MTIRGVYKTRGINPDNGKSNVVAFMLSERLGVTLQGGAMAPGVMLGFGDTEPFKPEMWDALTDAEYYDLTTSEGGST